MILNSVEIKNIRSYDHEIVQFPRGITLFEGDIGSGKSSVLMAIEFALFGTGSQRPGVLLRKREKESSVKLCFEVEGTSYELFRQIKQKGSNSLSQDAGYLQYNGTREDLSASDLKQRVLQVLRFNEPPGATAGSRIFRYAVFTPQEEMKTILENEELRLQTIRKAFGIEDYKTVRENAWFVLQKMGGKLSELRFENLEENREYKKDLEQKVQDIKNNTASLAKQKEGLDKKRTQTKQDLEKAQGRVAEKERMQYRINDKEEKIAERQEQYDEINKEISQYKEEIKQNERKISKYNSVTKPTSKTLEQLDGILKETKSKARALDRLQTKKESLEAEIGQIRNGLGEFAGYSLEGLEQHLKKIKDDHDRKDREYGRVSLDLEQKEQKRHRLEASVEELNSKIEKLQKAQAQCPVCEQDLAPDQVASLRQKTDEELKNAQKNLVETKNTIAELKSSKKQLESDTRELERKVHRIENEAIAYEKRRESKQQELEEHDRSISKLQSELRVDSVEQEEFPNGGVYHDAQSYLEAIKDRLREYENAAKSIEDLQKANQKRQQFVDEKTDKMKTVSGDISKLQEEITQLKEELKSMGDPESEKKNLEEKLEEFDAQIKSKEKDIATLSQKQKDKQEEIVRLQDEIAKAEESQKEYNRIHAYSQWIEKFFMPTMDTIESEVFNSIRLEFDRTYQNWYDSLIEDPTKHSRIEYDFSPVVEQDGYEQSLGYLSGGEKTSIALAYRLTLNSLMRKETEGLKSNLLILDEPTDGFSKTQLAKIRNVLKELRSQQIIIVSHEKELETYVDNIFYVSKENGVSHIIRR